MNFSPVRRDLFSLRPNHYAIKYRMFHFKRVSNIIGSFQNKHHKLNRGAP